MIEKHQPPQSLDAEQSVLGAIMKDNAVMGAMMELMPDESDFYFPKHQIIYRSFLDLHRNSEPCDITVVANHLSKSDLLEKSGGRLYLVELIESVASTSNVEHYARIVSEKSRLRRIISFSEELSRSAYDREMGSSDLSDLAMQFFSSVIPLSRRGYQLRPISTVVQEAYEQVMSLNAGMRRADVITGFADLDRIVELIPGRFIVVAGRPSMGKTAFALRVAENVAMTQNKPVDFFSLEMGDTELASRMMMGVAGVPIETAKCRGLSDPDVRAVGGAANKIGSAPLYIHQLASMKVFQLRDRLWQAKQQHGLGLVVVDYLGLMHPNKETGSRVNDVSAISQGLKSIAMELHVPILAVSQLSRAVEYRTNKRPTLADLRDSGSIEQDANIVMFMYREWYYLTDEEKRGQKGADLLNVAEAIVAKNRDGRLDTAHLRWDPDLARFDNLARDVA